jgi:fluoride exporter
MVASADLAPADMVPGRRQPPGSESRVLAAVAVGGALGALARYGVALALPTSGNAFPLSTWLINISGSLFLGFLLTVLTERRPPNRYARPFLATGFTGGYTTWSTFMVDTDLLVQHHHPLTAILYVLATLSGGLGAVAVGICATRRLPASRLTPLPSPRLDGGGAIAARPR